MKALIVIDMIKDFHPGGVLGYEGAKKIVEPIVDLIEEFKDNGEPVWFVNDCHISTDNELKIWGKHAIAGTEGADPIDEILPYIVGTYNNESGKGVGRMLSKHVYSAFHDGILHGRLQGQGVDEVYLVGHLAHICIRHSAADAFFLGYKVTLPTHAIGDIRYEDKWDAINEMDLLYDAKILLAE